MVQKDGSILFEKKYNQTTYRVITTEDKGRSVWTCVDVIENLKTGEKKTKTRLQWFNLFKKYEH